MRRKDNKNVTVIKKKLVRKWNLKDKDIKDRALREEGERRRKEGISGRRNSTGQENMKDHVYLETCL